MAKQIKKSIAWEALNHIKTERSGDWFWIVGVIAVGIAILAIFFDNFLFAFLVILATFTAFLLAHSAPRMIKYEINYRGIRIGESLYTFSGLESFWIIDEDGYERDRILFKSKKLFMPIITVPLGEHSDMEEIRNFLLEYLKEDEMHEPLSEILMDRLGF
ncbi:MAG TPA: hypothetical protein PKA60_00710 [Candidatus Paceibacterota bacterium]|nr:hypothetical protein [Candidatus Paceibacterota bacterium]